MRKGVQGTALWSGRFVILASWVVIPASVIVVTLVTRSA
jgi:hypothetical protein